MQEDALRSQVQLVRVSLDKRRFLRHDTVQMLIQLFKNACAVKFRLQLDLLHHEGFGVHEILEITDQLVIRINKDDLSRFLLQCGTDGAAPLLPVLLAGKAGRRDRVHIIIKKIEQQGQKLIRAGLIEKFKADHLLSPLFDTCIMLQTRRFCKSKKGAQCAPVQAVMIICRVHERPSPQTSCR